ncbi:polyhydroxyalkanoate synthesis repressor PhaR [Caulobacter segnis]|uniref:polyhydroxyalkanoate synthesis repressor PhaR n=1 Tax=Caulobacter segnis TaxID=88688 RepID=UPI00240F8D61|nr:polyhydroxyalkanoate synthesis repressor PhaR [Caulobacter segnis]MDG2519934.1 polyhydroxyalkanoate synthesis repressor PhaR [Caulobacter segnis]
MSENNEAAEGKANAKSGERVVIKKYANRRLYNTASSSYVTLEHLAEMVKEGVDFVVYDAKTNEDITRPVLTQIIFEEESKGQTLLPIQFLRQLIGFYGNSMQAFLPSYLELSLESFAKQQERMRSQFETLTPGAFAAKGFAAGAYDEQIRQNLALFDRAMKMFSPFAFTRPGEEDAAPRAAEPAAPAPQPAASDDSLADLKRQLDAMQQQIEKLASKP